MAQISIVERISELCASEVEAQGCELVEVEYVKEGGHWYLRLYIDKPDGVGLEDCELVSQRISTMMDLTDPIVNTYILEVSSPGLERPLKRAADYLRFRGKTVKVKTFIAIEGSKTHTGQLLGLEGDAVLLEVAGKTMAIPLAQVAKANLVCEF